MMLEALQADRILEHNAINKFILKIDVIKQDGYTGSETANYMINFFDRLEKREVLNISVNLKQDASAHEISDHKTYEYVLISEDSGTVMTFSDTHNIIWIECTKYKDNSAYKDIIRNLTYVLRKNNINIKSKRIGLRYINKFDCENYKKISSIYGSRLSRILKLMLCGENQSRIIGVEDYNYDDYKIRLQYGIYNKFYPAKIATYDLLLDIDCYIENTSDIDDWESSISILN
ncbi:TIGR04255 family protein, partial [Chlorobium sp.]|uniref:TIGR04255 family protein n=1 Tax=Chlorobium sp. TaxID=1095 RepID=UPI003C6F4024